MVSFARRQPDLERYGPRLEIEVRHPIVRTPAGIVSPKSTKQQDAFSRMPALIDTGASRTVLTPEAIQKLHLAMIDEIQVSRAGGSDRRGVYAVSIQFPRQKLSTIELMEVICCELPDQPIQCLIGRDILARWKFVYDGPTTTWSIEEQDVAAWIDPNDYPDE